MKQPLELTPSAPLAGSTRSISNTLTYLCTASVAPEASAANKYRKPSVPPPPGPPKPGQHAKPMKVTQITHIELPIDHSQHIRFQNKEVKEIKEAILYQALEGHGRRRYYYNKTKEEIKVRKKYKRDEIGRAHV